VTECSTEPSLPLADQLAGRVVDRRDVVGVERVAQPQGVGGDAEPDPEAAGLPDPHVPGRDGDREHAEAEHVQGDDRRRESADAPPLGARQSRLRPS
jgi:hypothetical protein